MTNLEKTIRGLECCRSSARPADCPYLSVNMCIPRLCDDAIALLRGQEEERERLVRWLGKFCAHADQQYQPRFTDEANIEFFRQKMREQFGWKV